MRIIADLHLHSKYSRAVSPQMVLPTIAQWAEKKGIGLVGTGDFTHPMWFRELKNGLKEAGNGIYQVENTKFLLTTEVSCIYSDKGKGRRVHLLIIFPELSDVEKFNQDLTANGANLFSDGRPIMGLSLKRVAQIALNTNPKVILIPAHAWTPWFGIYGANSGYDSLDEAFEDLAKYVPAVETGLSSDPAMNWRMGELTNRQIVSFSDAHSPAKIGREATVFKIENLSFEEIRKLNIASTIEFYPEEGKYHFTGHRKCGVVYSPNEARKMGLTCPVCGRALTPGVMSRVESLGRNEIQTETEKDKFGVRWIFPKGRNRPGYVMSVPLLEILAEALGSGVASLKVVNNYQLIINNFQNEFKVLLETPIEKIQKVAGEKVAEAITKVRSGDIAIEPGYDGVFGKVKVWPASAHSTSLRATAGEPALSQTSLF